MLATDFEKALADLIAKYTKDELEDEAMDIQIDSLKKQGTFIRIAFSDRLGTSTRVVYITRT